MNLKDFKNLKPGDAVMFHRVKRNQPIKAEGKVTDLPRGDSVDVELTHIIERDIFLVRLYTEGTPVLATPDELDFPPQQGE